MTIPNFKSVQDCNEFIDLFNDRWQVKFECLTSVKDDMFPGYGWQSLPPSSIETINDITQSLLYDVEFTFKEQHPEYKDEEDEMFIPRRTFKDDVTQALKEAMNDEDSPWDSE